MNHDVQKLEINSDNDSPSFDYLSLKEPLFLGENEGLEVAKMHYIHDSINGLYNCNLCKFSSPRSQQLNEHVLAKHLTQIYLYRCDICGELVRYSKFRFKEHLELHRFGKVKCGKCPPNTDEAEKEYSKDGLKAHLKRNHTPGRFTCPVDGCSQEFITKSDLKFHQKDLHLTGLPAKYVTHVCKWCDYSFPTKSRLKKHIILCQRGTSRTGFRKQISDVLQWLGKGAYKCTFCEAEFHPEPNNVTRTGLPEARNHVASVHGMKHMRKAKMQWHGDPKHLDKDDLYRDKTPFWNQKLKDIERVRSLAQQRNHLFDIKQEIDENIADAAKSSEERLKAEKYSEMVTDVGAEFEEEVLISIIDGEIEERHLIVDDDDGGQLILHAVTDDFSGNEMEVVSS